MEANPRRYWSALPLVLLVLADLVFVGLHLGYEFGLTGDRSFALTVDRGYAELYQYLKLFWITVALVGVAFEKRRAIYGVGAVTFSYLLLDDSLEIHETAGGLLADGLGFEAILGLRAQDYGELAVSGAAGLAFLSAGFLAYRSAGATGRRFALFLLGGLLLLAVFGVGVDLLGVLAHRIPLAGSALALLEDGGELIVVSGILWFVGSFAVTELGSLRVRSPLS